MAKKVSQLILALRKEEEIYEDIIELAKRKQEAILTKDLNVLNDIVKKEEAFAISLVKLEEIRTSTINDLIKENNLMEVKEITDLYPFMKDQEIREVDSIRKKLRSTVDILAQKNELNEKLIEQLIEKIEFDLNVLTMVGEGSVNYRGNAEDTDVERKSIFDRKI